MTERAADAAATAAGELYALPPSAFTAARDARVRELKADGDRDAAESVRRFARPTAAAWLVNQLARRGALDDALALGDDLRRAQAEGDRAALADLMRERRTRLAAVAQQARRVAEEEGNPVGTAVVDDVVATVTAGIADAWAGAAVASGRLVRTLELVGLEVDLDGAVAGVVAPPATADRPRAVSRSSESPTETDVAADAARRHEAERAIAEATERVRAATASVEDAARRTDELERRRDALSDERADLEERLERVRDAILDAERGLRSAATERDRARTELDRARGDLRSAQASAQQSAPEP